MPSSDRGHRSAGQWLSDDEAFHLLLDNIQDYALFVIGTDGTIRSWNKGVERVLGYPEDGFVGRHFSVLFPSEDVASGAAETELRVAAATGRAEDERWHIRFSGARFWASGVLTALRDESGALRGFAKIMRDVTERKLAEEERKQLLLMEQGAREEAEAASRVRDYFLATLSHELRTPLNAVVGWTHLLKSGRLTPDSMVRAIETIERNALAQAKLIDDLLELPRLLAGKVTLEVQRVEAVGLVRMVAEGLAPQALGKGVRMESHFACQAAHVAGDPRRLQQVLSNLIGNAIKFTPRGGAVVVAVTAEEAQVSVSVADTGQGIDAPFLQYVFDPFRQGEEGTARQHGGLGLGLAIAKHLIEKHGGTIAVDSPGANRGATFTVRLPASAAGSTDPLPAPVETTLSLVGVRVLVIDDDADSREVAMTGLELAGATVQGAGSVREGLEAVATNRPNVVVCDLGMPLEDGFAFIAQLRALSAEDGGRTPALALTAHIATEDRLRALTAGYQLHVAKPIDLDALIVAVGGLCGLTSRQAPGSVQLPPSN